jgi:hypothetical protein
LWKTNEQRAEGFDCGFRIADCGLKNKRAEDRRQKMEVGSNGWEARQLGSYNLRAPSLIYKDVKKYFALFAQN